MQYAGGKNGAGVYQLIINQLPPHDVFCEVFCGSAPIWRRKTPADTTVLIDLDEGVLQWSVARADGDPSLMARCVDAIPWLHGLAEELPRGKSCRRGLVDPAVVSPVDGLR